MKRIFFVLLFVVSCSASAVSVAIAPGVGVAATSSGYTTAANFVGQFSAASFNSGFTTSVGGRPVTMPASMRLAANAGNFAAAAVRLNPTALIGSAVAAWLLPYGMQWVAGQWQKVAPPIPAVMSCLDTGWVWNSGGHQACTAGALCTLLNGGGFSSHTATEIECLNVQTYKIEKYPFSRYQAAPQSCPGGYAYGEGGVCVALPKPATDADWAALPNPLPLPDSAASELAPKMPLPLENPEFNPKYVDLPLNDPYLDPVNQRRYRDQARVTPQSDRKTAEVQTTKQEVDENGQPKQDPETGQTKNPEEQKDFCKSNPEAIACLEKGETDDEPLKQDNRGGSITPVVVGGGGSCPSPRNIPLPGGGATQFSYQPICDAASMIHPVVLAIAWLLAGYILLGAVRNE